MIEASRTLLVYVLTFVSAGFIADAAQTIVLPDLTTELDATVIDDGLPATPVQMFWQMVGGPGPMSFTNPLAVDMTVTFPSIGICRLQLSADDGESIVIDEVQMAVAAVSDRCAKNQNRNSPPRGKAGAAVTRQLTINGGASPVK